MAAHPGYNTVKSIVAGLQSDEAQARKLAAFSLQGLLAKDTLSASSFAEAGGLPVLRRLILDDRGNTLAYALGSFTQLLERNIGWGQVEKSIVSLALDLVVGRPVINVLRNALHLLVLVVTQAPPEEPLDLKASLPPSSHSFDYESLKTTLKDHPAFLECLAERLSAADHALCANVLKLINGLLRDSIDNGTELDWPVFYKQLQDLGILVAVEQIMRGDTLSDLLDHILDFQNLVKALMKRWKAVEVTIDSTMHRTALLAVHHSSFLPSPSPRRRASSVLNKSLDGESPTQDETTWRRLGFTSERPARDFSDMGLLGLIDLTEYVRASNDEFEKTLLEQSVLPVEERCPIAQASLYVSRVLYDYFKVDSEGAADQAEDKTTGSTDDADGSGKIDNVQPNLMRLDVIHTAAVGLFNRLWTSARAQTTEFEKISNLVYMFLVKTLQDSSRKDNIESVRDKLNNATLAQIRELQAKYLDAQFQAAWGNDLVQLRTRVHDEAMRFMQEQRIRCLLAGAWFPVVVESAQIPSAPPSGASRFDGPSKDTVLRSRVSIHSWRFVRLSPGRRHLHHSLYGTKPVSDPDLSEMRNRIDVTCIKSVVSNVTVVDWAPEDDQLPPPVPDKGTASSANKDDPERSTVLTQMQIVGVPKRTKDASGTPTLTTIPGVATMNPGLNHETTLLELHTGNQSLASEWLDGLLMLLNQKPITADSEKMIRLIADWSLKAKVMNLDDADRDARAEALRAAGEGLETLPVPSREGLDEEFWYSMGDEQV